MGATGPCGPCTEIHYDRIGNRNAAEFVNADRPDVIEIWNNVFIQFNRENDGSLRELPNKHVDTGMGFERLASILQGKDSNYDTDIFRPIFEEIRLVTGCRSYQGKLGDADVGLVDMAYRVVADHIRTLTFAIADGAVPSNEGRGYVLRRILRRAVRYGQEMLNAPSGFFAKLVKTVVSNFSGAFPELLNREDFVRSVIADEELSFGRTLDQGVRHFKKVINSLESTGQKLVQGKEAHILFTSMGFPLDLTELMAAERGFAVNKEEFNNLMENDRKISEAAELARKGSLQSDLSLVAEQTSWLANQNIPTTDSNLKYDWFVQPSAKVLAIYAGGNNFVSQLDNSTDVVGVILDKTSFYYESGGQVSDIGTIDIGSDSCFSVSSAQSYGGYVLHLGSLINGGLKVGDTVTLSVDYSRRQNIAPNHTITHVLNFALRKVLLKTNVENSNGLCEQRGSLVDSEKLRFDFSWSSGLSITEVEAVQSIVNEIIKKDYPVFTQTVALNEASSIVSLRKVFGEAYPDPVRVVSVGRPIEELLKNPSNAEWFDFSIEFCGGTHLSATSQAVNFVIVEESGIAKGTRRIIAFTREQALAAINRAKALDDRLNLLESSEVSGTMINQFKELKKDVRHPSNLILLQFSHFYGRSILL